MDETKETDIAKVPIQLGMVREREVMQARAQEMGYGFVDLDRVQVESSTINLVAGELAIKHTILPVKKQDNTLYLAICNPGDLQALDAVSLATGCRVVPILATREAIEQALHRYYSVKTEG